MKNFIKWSEDGTSFEFQFTNGSESLTYTSKEDGLEAVEDLFEKDKITEEEVGEMSEEIINAENLPDFSEDEEAFLLFLSLFKLMHLQNKESVEFAELRVCEKCGRHGRIIFKKGTTSDFGKKEDGMEILVLLQKESCINAEEFEAVKKQIEESTLA